MHAATFDLFVSQAFFNWEATDWLVCTQTEKQRENANRCCQLTAEALLNGGNLSLLPSLIAMSLFINKLSISSIYNRDAVVLKFGWKRRYEWKVADYIMNTELSLTINQKVKQLSSKYLL